MLRTISIQRRVGFRIVPRVSEKILTGHVGEGKFLSYMGRSSTSDVRGGSRGREVAGIVLLGLAIFVGLSVASLQLGAGNLMGPCGATVGLGVYALFGVGSYLFSFGLGVGAIRCLAGRPL